MVGISVGLKYCFALGTFVGIWVGINVGLLVGMYDRRLEFEQQLNIIRFKKT